MNNGVTFSSTECYDSADKLKNSALQLNTILNTNIKNLMESAMRAYDSEGAKEIYAAYASVQAKFDDFINSVTSCSDYLRNTVAPSYEAIENKVQQNVNM